MGVAVAVVKRACQAQFAPPVRLFLEEGTMRVISAVVVLALAAASLAAFDYDEHKYLSNIGLRAALDLAPPCAQKGEAELFLARANIEAKKSFGDLAGLGDYVRDVDVLFERQGASGLMIEKYSDLDWDHIVALKREPLRFLQAAHLNETHFQQAALLSHLDRHEAARALARDGNIHRALVMEAYGLHFLEDFHAPGHIAATRAAMVDYVAIASHGKYNSAGLKYQFQPAARMLLPIVNHLIDIAGSLAMLRHDDARSIKIDQKALMDLRDAIEACRAVEFYGDSSLREHPMQAAYIAVLAARSVLDVLEASCDDGKAHNHFVPVCWVVGTENVDAAECDMEEDGFVRSAAIPFGKWNVSTHHFYRVWYKPWDVNLISYYTESHNATEGDLVRGQVAIESLLWSGVSRAMFVRRDLGNLGNTVKLLNLSVGYGYSHTFSDLPSDDLHMKVIYAFPRVDLQVASTVGVRRYDLGRRSRVRYPLTLGLETGYGFLFAHVGITEVPFINPITGGLRHERSIRSGITIVLPTRTGIEFVGRKIAGK
jgi:hypothetical protein